MSRSVTLAATAPVAWAAVRRALDARGDAILGVPGETPGTYERSLSSRLTTAGTAVAHPVVVLVHGRYGNVVEGNVSWDIGLQAPAHEGRFPTFEGVLALRARGQDACDLELRGTYEVPLGIAGRVGDRVLGQRIVTDSLEGFLHDLARELEVFAATEAGHAAPAGRAEEPPDLYIG